MEIRQLHALAVKLIDVRRFDHGVTVRRDFTVTLIIGQQNNDVWLTRRRREARRDCEARKEQA